MRQRRFAREPAATRARLRGGLIAAALLFGADAALAQSESDRDMREVFEQILRDPNNPALNFRYARMASERGDYRKALAACERVLARDPNNAEAKACLERLLRASRPAYTTINIVLGAQYETNPRHERRTGKRTDDGAALGRVTISDERPLGDIYWRTEGDVAAQYYFNFRDIEIGTVGARTGPLIDIADGLKLNPFVGFYYSWLERRTFNGEPTAGIILETERTGPLKTVTARWGYDLVGRHLSERDGIFVEVNSVFEFRNLVVPGSLAAVSPYWRYNGVTGSGALTETPFNQPFPARQHQIGARADYFVPALSWLYVNVNFTYEYRHYFEQIPLEDKNRRDHVFAPGGQLIFGSFAENRLDVVASYVFEYRHSNDGSQRYMNHVAGLRLLWRM
jgi:tetratricopeptide (TPR) repeat protein